MNIARPGCILAGLVLMWVAGSGCDEKHPAIVATPPLLVEVSHPIEREVTDFQVFTARTQAVQSVDVKARVTGYLTKILFTDGDNVKEGQVLFQIDDRPYKAALDLAVANLEFSKASLIKTQADYDIGLDVQKRDPGAISQQEVVKRLGARDESRASVDKARADVENAQLNFDWCKVTSPLAGRANRHFIDVGNVISKDMTTLTNVVSLKPTWVYFDVDQNTVLAVQQLVAEGKVKATRGSKIPVDLGLSNSSGFPFKGAIDFISNQVDPNTGTLRCRATYPNEDGMLSAGLFARIRVPISATHLGLLVADRAIGVDQGANYILVVNAKNEVEYRPVSVGQLHGGLREVLAFREVVEAGPGGQDVKKKVEVLRGSDRVMVDGLQRVRPGATVEPKMVDMATFLSESGPAPQKAPAAKGTKIKS